MGSNIEYYDSYEICKKFHIDLKPVATYLVKTIGIDTHERKWPKAVRRGKRLPHFNRRLARLLHDLLAGRKKNKELKKIYHELEPV